jgi:DUF1680 family protein
MPVSRRSFLRNTACAGVGILTVEPSSPAALLADFGTPQLSRYLSGMRMAATPATDYRAYRSKPVTNPDTPTWVQIDLGRALPIEAVMLYPASERMYPGRDQYYGGEGFPLRFRIEASDDEDFSRAKKIADCSDTDFPDPGDSITRYPASGVTGRYVRLTATRLRPVKENRREGGVQDSRSFTLTLAKIGVIGNGSDVATNCRATADAACGNPGDLQQLTRPARQDGEAVHYDLPKNVTHPHQWRPVKYKAETPRSGVMLGDGVFRTATQNNIRYLMDSYTTADLLRQFYERTGAVKGYKATGSAVFWEEDLAGSNAGRFLMGAGNTLRWIHDTDLQQKMTAVVDGIAACRQANGYIMAYPEETIFYSERGAYTRAWLTHGLLEAGYAGDKRGFELLRGYYDWFNRQPHYLPELLRGAVQGGQGMIANTRVALSPMGKAEDVQVIQRYFQENAWLDGLSRRDPRQIWQYPYDRPHCYLLTDLEAYLDLYRATGEQRYHDAVMGGWEMYREHWQQPGGSISIIEFRRDPPDSNYLHEKLGELCGNSFWVFLSQRFQLMNPDDERFTTEIEKSIYNVALANQDGSQGLRYHTILEGQKEKSTGQNTCCEGQGTRLIGSLPEHIYSMAEDGLYVNLYEPSQIEWQHGDARVTLAMQTRFPFAPEVRCSLTSENPVQASIRVRTPSWAIRPMEISVNGRVAATGQAGTYTAIDRTWSTGDRVEFTLPIGWRARKYVGADQVPGRLRYSFEYGPVLYAAVGSDAVELPADFDPERVAEELEPVPGSPMQLRIRGVSGIRFIPYWQISSEVFTCFPRLIRGSSEGQANLAM